MFGWCGSGMTVRRRGDESREVDSERRCGGARGSSPGRPAASARRDATAASSTAVEIPRCRRLGVGHIAVVASRQRRRVRWWRRLATGRSVRAAARSRPSCGPVRGAGVAWSGAAAHDPARLIGVSSHTETSDPVAPACAATIRLAHRCREVAGQRRPLRSLFAPWDFGGIGSSSRATKACRSAAASQQRTLTPHSTSWRTRTAWVVARSCERRSMMSMSGSWPIVWRR